MRSSACVRSFCSVYDRSDFISKPDRSLTMKSTVVGSLSREQHAIVTLQSTKDVLDTFGMTVTSLSGRPVILSRLATIAFSQDSSF